MAFDYEPDQHQVTFPISHELFERFEKTFGGNEAALGKAIEKVLNQRTDRFYVDEPENMEIIVFCGQPLAFDDLKEAERFAARKAESQRVTYTIMSVPKVSREIALAAVYHGVVIHGLSKLDSEAFEEED